MNEQIAVFYGLIGSLYIVLFYLIAVGYSRQIPLTFLNLSAIYYFAFFYVPYYWISTGAFLKTADYSVQFARLSLFYSVTLLLILILYNIQLLSKTSTLAGMRDDYADIRRSPGLGVLISIISFKAVMFLIEPTPLQHLLFLGDFAGALIAQGDFHTGGQPLIVTAYSMLNPVCAFLLTYMAIQQRSKLLTILLLCLAIESSGWYFSKSHILIPILAYLFFVRRNAFFLLVLIVVMTLGIFAIRLNEYADLDYILEHLFGRFITETGYALVHLKLINPLDPPLHYYSRYFLGFNTLFGITPAGAWSTAAYTIETGKEGATTSGFAAVSQYAFFGNFLYIYTPLLITGIAMVDLKLVAMSRRSVLLSLGYLYFSFQFINAITVDLFRVIDPRVLISPVVMQYALLVYCIHRSMVKRRFLW